MPLTLTTQIIDLYRFDIAKLSAALSRKLAVALAGHAGRANVDDVTVEDLLNYFPARYEDRSNFISIDNLEEGLEAAVEVHVRGAAGIRVGRNRDPRKPLFLFEITGGDAERRFKPITVKWFVSGKNAASIVQYYEQKFVRGTRFVAFGKWEYDKSRQTYFLKLAKPDELELLPPVETGLFAKETAANIVTKRSPTEDEDLNEDVSSPELATVHTARHVPVYRKLGPFQT
jgi:RecG-like helicase